jgi:hypothetical protein
LHHTPEVKTVFLGCACLITTRILFPFRFGYCESSVTPVPIKAHSGGAFFYCTFEKFGSLFAPQNLSETCVSVVTSRTLGINQHSHNPDIDFTQLSTEDDLGPQSSHSP